MIIGHFKYDAKSDTYTGDVNTFTTERANIQLVPVEQLAENGPAYRLVGKSPLGTVEFGAAWKKTSKEGDDYLSVSIDDPSLSRGINAALMKAQKKDDAILIWSRPAKA